MFCEVIDLHMPKPSLNFREEDQTSFDVIMEQRRFNLQMASNIKLQTGLITRENAGTDANPVARIPPELERNYQAVLVPGDGDGDRASVVDVREENHRWGWTIFGDAQASTTDRQLVEREVGRERINSARKIPGK